MTFIEAAHSEERKVAQQRSRTVFASFRGRARNCAARPICWVPEPRFRRCVPPGRPPRPPSFSRCVPPPSGGSLSRWVPFAGASLAV